MYRRELQTVYVFFSSTLLKATTENQKKIVEQKKNYSTKNCLDTPASNLHTYMKKSFLLRN